MHQVAMPYYFKGIERSTRRRAARVRCAGPMGRTLATRRAEPPQRAWRSPRCGSTALGPLGRGVPPNSRRSAVVPTHACTRRPRDEGPVWGEALPRACLDRASAPRAQLAGRS